MKISIEDEPGRASSVYLNGQIVCETFGGVATDRDALMENVTRARRLEAFARSFDYCLKRISTIVNIEDHINTSPVAKQQQFVRGLFDGLKGKSHPHPMPGIPDIPPDSTSSYLAGYEYGESLKQCADSLRGCEAP